ncbi:MAG: hypothetical protein ABSB74_00540 [Tepidisphaeraceae bacterium]
MRGTKALRQAQGRHVGTKGKFASLVLIFIVLNCLCIDARGDTLSLPLNGYFHPGRAMPVRWDISSANTSSGIIQLSASGAIASRVQWSGNPRGIFPWLVFDRNAGDVRWQLPAASGVDFPALHPLEDSDCLVVSTLDDDSPAAALFPGRRLILLHPPINVDGPAMAWETLDAVLLTPDALAKISPSAGADLFAAGVELAVIGEARPDAMLPWRHNGRWWIACSNLRFPATVDSDAYAPAYGWIAGRSGDFRLHIFLLGAIYCLIVCGIALWRSPWMPAAIVAASICAGFVYASENRKYSPVFRRSGVVRLIDEAAFNDHWVYQVSHRDAEISVPVEDSIHPIFYDSSQPKMMNLTIDFGDHGQPVAISGRLVADQPLALMSRRLQSGNEGAGLVNPPTSPMRLLATEPIYRGFRLQGELGSPMPDDSWAGIVLRQR